MKGRYAERNEYYPCAKNLYTSALHFFERGINVRSARQQSQPLNEKKEMTQRRHHLSKRLLKFGQKFTHIRVGANEILVQILIRKD
jgi:hypothetical protein